MTVHTIIFYLFIFYTGCIFGSFYQVIIYRLPRNISFVYGRSLCDKCGHTLGFFDLIPVFSYAGLKGRCRYCGSRIPVSALIGELVTGALFTLAFIAGYPESGLYGACRLIILWSMLYIVTAIDLEHQLIYDQVLLVFSLMYIILQVVSGVMKEKLIFDAAGFFTGIIFYGIIYVIARLVYKKEAFGQGDVLLIGAAGMFLGPLNTLVTGFMAFYCALCFILAGFLRNKERGMEMIPFGPSIAAAVFIMSLAGDRITSFIISLLGF